MIVVFGAVIGVRMLLRGIGTWSAVSQLGRLHCRVRGGWFLMRHYMACGRQSVWSKAAVRWDVPTSAFPAPAPEGIAEFRAALARGRGVILLGAHYGPWGIWWALYRAGIRVRAVIATDVREERAVAVCALAQASGRRRAACGVLAAYAEDQLQAGLSEREMIRHLRKGGAVLMLLDWPHPAAVGVSVRMLGDKQRVAAFPFRLALRHGHEVFFAAMEGASAGAYRLRLQPFGVFAEAEDGAQRYADFVTSLVRSDPAEWKYLPSLVYRLPGGPLRL